MGIFNWVLDLVPVLGVVVGWIRKLFNIKLVAFLLFQGIIFFLAYKFMPFLFGSFFRWIFKIGSSVNPGVDLSFLNVLTSSPVTGLGAWFFYSLKLDTVFHIMISGAVARISLKSVPFIGK